MDESADHAALVNELTDTFLAAPWSVDGLAESGASCLDRWPVWMTALAMRVVAVYRNPPHDDRGLSELVAGFLAEHRAFLPENDPPIILRYLTELPEPPPTETPSPRPPFAHDWPIADVPSVVELAERLELSYGQLAWLADVRGLERTVVREQLRNYRYRTVARHEGLPRVIEAPKARLKEVQRWILHAILDQVPTHPAAHGFTRGRSVVTHAEQHLGQAAVLRLDLKDFFASVPAGRVYGIWRTLGYSRSVAHVLTGLTTNTLPAPVWEEIAKTTPADAVQARFWLGRELATPHLPQGAPTSPALANLVAFRLDRRLTGLARASGLQYSRYADDLTFSGSARLSRRRLEFEAAAATIVRAEGFRLNKAKSLTQSAAGRQTVCGVVVNVRPNVSRTDYDRLKAILHNAIAGGASSQNRSGQPDFKAHLRGRISWVESLNPERGRKLRGLFDAIEWE